MTIRLLSHVNADGDLIDAWFRHYQQLGVGSFHLIVHGPRVENERLHEIRDRYPVLIEQSYTDTFDVREKKRRLDQLLRKYVGEWVVLVDSDEFLELPYRGLAATTRVLRWAGANALQAPMLQHLSQDGSLETPPIIDDPFLVQSLCSVDLYRLMGSAASIDKYPLFLCGPDTELIEGGNHNPPRGCERFAASLRGVLHHFKFRRCVLDRLERRIDSAHPFRGESVEFRDFLRQHDYRVPVDGAFAYSRAELFRRNLLRRPNLGTIWHRATRRLRRGAPA
jgi:hypothetical protein